CLRNGSICTPPCRVLRLSLRFLFQADDGIRDFHVTGVQTCALPISILMKSPGTLFSRIGRLSAAAWPIRPSRNSNVSLSSSRRRSEERRVGKVWRGWRATSHPSDSTSADGAAPAPLLTTDIGHTEAS